MPDANKSVMDKWVGAIVKAILGRAKTAILLWHSLGRIIILRYLELLNPGKIVKGALLVAGFSEDLNILQITNFLSKSVDCAKIKPHSKNFVALNPDDYHYVPLRNGYLFEKELGAHLYVKYMGHFQMDELPIVLQILMDMAANASPPVSQTRRKQRK